MTYKISFKVKNTKKYQKLIDNLRLNNMLEVFMKGL